MAQRKSFIYGIGLTEANSSIHLMNNNDTMMIINFTYSSTLLIMVRMTFLNCCQAKRVCLLSGNIQSINAKFDEFSSFVDRVNTHNPISAILSQECWIDDSAIDSLAMFNLKDYNMVYQTTCSRCCRHGGLLI